MSYSIELGYHSMDVYIKLIKQSQSKRTQAEFALIFLEGMIVRRVIIKPTCMQAMHATFDSSIFVIAQ